MKVNEILNVVSHISFLDYPGEKWTKTVHENCVVMNLRSYVVYDKLK